MKTPALFLAHGDPMNALRNNAFTQSLGALGRELLNSATPPKAILVVSAHWLTRGTWVNDAAEPRQIYDFGGFPDELYRVVYPAHGSPETARRTALLDSRIGTTGEWGIDHGTWTVLCHLFPRAEIPVFQLSIDFDQPLAYHLDLGRKLAELRNEGVLIVGSGNIVHNLRAFFSDDESQNAWGREFDDWVKEKLETGNWDQLADLGSAGKAGRWAAPTPDHYIPLLYTLAVSDPSEKLTYPHEEIYRSLSMRCVRLG